MKIDLHLHSVCSDGGATPTDLIKFAVAAGVDTLSICDSDNMKCLEEAKEMSARYQMRYIPGITIGAWYAPLDMNIHLMGFHVDDKNDKLNALIDRMWEEAKENVNRKIDVLRKENIDIDLPLLKKFVLKKYPNYPQKQIISKVVREYVEEQLNIGISIGEYIMKVLRKYHVELIEYHDHLEVLDVLQSAGAKIFLSHPGYYMFRNIKTSGDIEKMILNLKEQGVAGIEAYTPMNPPYYRSHFANFARNNGLLVISGSDYQGNDPRTHNIGSMELPGWALDGLINSGFFYNKK